MTLSLSRVNTHYLRLVLGYGDLGSYPNPRDEMSLPRIKTPHIDVFATEGMLFTDAYAGHSVCAPSRHSLMSGLHTGHFPGDQLKAGSVTIAAVLHKHGYDTALIGKWD